MVALVVFLITVPSITYGFIIAFNTSGDNRDRVLASELFTQALDAARSVPFANVPIGTTTTTQTVDGAKFTINQTVQPVAPPEQSTDVCGASTSGSGSDDYLLVSVSVSWRDAQTAAPPPVSGDTMLAPPATVIASGDAEVIIQVFSADGNPAVGVPVTINTLPNETVTTNSNGCAAFPYLTPGQSYTLSAANYVDPNQQAASFTTPVLSLNQTFEQTSGIIWDLPTTLNANIQTDCLEVLTGTATDTYGPCTSTDVVYPSSCDGPAACSVGPVPIVFVPPASPSDLVTSAANPNGTFYQASATGFPFYTNYEAWAGTCADAEPASSFIEGLTSVPGSTAMIWPGNPDVTLFAQPLTMTATDFGTSVSVTHVADSNCTQGEQYTYILPTQSQVPPGDTVALAIPVGGNWTITGGYTFAIPPTSGSGIPL